MRTLNEIREYLIQQMDELSDECDESLKKCKEDLNPQNLENSGISHAKLLMVEKIAKFVVGD